MATYSSDQSDDSSDTSDEDQSDRSSDIALDLERIHVSDDEEEIIKMYQTVLHHITGWTCAKTTYLFYKIHGENTLVKKTNIPMSQGNKHAEKLMIEDFRQKICKNKIFVSLRHIPVYLNNSPCSSITHNCTNNLRNFLKDYEDVKLKIYVTSLYNIRRKSCDKEKNKHNRFIDVEDHFANSTGLWNLMQHDRCEVKAYSKEIWEKLLKELKLSNSDEHDLLKTYTDKRNGNDRSREEEDKRIQEDLRSIGHDIVEQIWKGNPDDRDSVTPACLICTIESALDFEAIKLMKCDQGDKHAEELLLAELKELDFLMPKITIFMNDTPCSLPGHNCADKLIQFIKAKQVELTLYITSLIESNEETCTKKEKTKKQTNLPDCSTKDETRHKAGLARLKGSCTVKGRSKDAREALSGIMEMCIKD